MLCINNKVVIFSVAFLFTLSPTLTLPLAGLGGVSGGSNLYTLHALALFSVSCSLMNEMKSAFSHFSSLLFFFVFFTLKALDVNETAKPQSATHTMNTFMHHVT